MHLDMDMDTIQDSDIDINIDADENSSPHTSGSKSQRTNYSGKYTESSLSTVDD